MKNFAYGSEAKIQTGIGKTACGNWFDDRAYEYCSCGRRIIYKEEE